MRILGIDFGDIRIGVAISDPLGLTAQGIETITWAGGSIKRPAERIRFLSAQYGVEKIVIGYPINMNGTIGPGAEKVSHFAELLEKKTGLEVVKWDERLTSVEANRTMHDLEMRTSKKRESVDRIAAVLILQGYLDSGRK